MNLDVGPSGPCDATRRPCHVNRSIRPTHPTHPTHPQTPTLPQALEGKGGAAGAAASTDNGAAMATSDGEDSAGKKKKKKKEKKKEVRLSVRNWGVWGRGGMTAVCGVGSRLTHACAHIVRTALNPQDGEKKRSAEEIEGASPEAKKEKKKKSKKSEE